MKRFGLALLAFALAGAGPLHAAELALSIGIRETNNDPATTPIFSNAGSTGGIEFVNLDGQALVADGTWQLFTFTPATDTLTAFAGTTANSSLEAGLQMAALEHIRIRNTNGITDPIQLWIDDVTNTVAGGPVIESFEGRAPGTKVMFEDPSFSGSTTGNLLPGSASGVSDSTANSGSQSYQTDFQFVDATDTRWVRLTTFGGTQELPNPAIRVREATGGPATISFYAKAVVVPEPATATLAALAATAVTFTRRQRRK